MDPEGKVAIVTGGSSGIGRATALALAAAGASVVVADVNAEGGAETVSLIDQAGGTAVFVKCDVTSRESLEAAVAFAEGTYGGLDILHNNAGIGTPPPRYPDAPPERWEQTLAVDLWSVIAGSQEAVPALRRRGGGVIISTASMAGIIQYQPDPIYAAAKHAVVGLTRALAFLKGEANIRVNCICPGVVDTPLITSGLDDLTPEQRAQHEAIIGRMALIQPGEVAEAVLALVRDDSLAGEAMGILYGRPPRLIPPAVAFSHDPSQQLPSSRAD